MSVLVDLMQDECLELLRSQVVGRIAMSTPSGPRILPVNYSVVGDAVVIRTMPYSLIGTYGRSADLALEVDQLDAHAHEGWSVVVTGYGEMVDDADELREIREKGDPEPWAGGQRHLYIRLRWREITGRRMVAERGQQASRRDDRG